MYHNRCLHKLLWVVLSLLLIVAPLQNVRAQETESGNTSDDVTLEVDAADTPSSEDLVAAPAGDLPNKTFLPVIQGGDNGSEGNSEETDEVVAAFAKTWALANTNINVPDTDCGLWDDMPGAGSTEAGLFWMVTNQSADETCSYNSFFSPVLANRLSIRVAVNDGAMFKVKVYVPSAFNGCNTPLASSSPLATDDDSSFRNYIVDFAPAVVCRVQIVLTDDADSVASKRASALIDYIVVQQRNSSINIVNVWVEHFTASN